MKEPLHKAANLRDMPVEAVPERRGDIVLRMVQTTIAKELGYAKPDDLDAGRHLQDFGIDSLAAVLMRNRLATLTGITLPPNITLLHPNLKSIRDYLLSKLTSEIDEPKIMMTAASHVDMTAIRRAVLDPKIQFRNVTNQACLFSAPQKCIGDRPNWFCWRVHGIRVSSKRHECVLSHTGQRLQPRARTDGQDSETI